MKWWWCPISTRPTHLIGSSGGASSMTQQSAGRPIAPLGHIILISRQPFFAEKQQIPKFKVFGLTWPGFEPTSTALEASTLTITPSMRSKMIIATHRPIIVKIVIFDCFERKPYQMYFKLWLLLCFSVKNRKYVRINNS